jgi:hypothetical protein
MAAFVLNLIDGRPRSVATWVVANDASSGDGPQPDEFGYGAAR